MTTSGQRTENEMPPKGQGQAGARRTAGSRPGDATGREKERLEKEARPAIEEAATRVSLTSAPVVENVDEVIDYSDGGAPSAAEAVAGVRLVSMEEAIGDGDTDHSVDDIPLSALSAEQLADLPDGKTDVRPETIERTEEPQPAARPPQSRPVATATAAPTVEAAFKIMRVNTDLPDVTIGKDNHFTFRENQRYKVPAFVYEHLDEKGYVYH